MNDWELGSRDVPVLGAGAIGCGVGSALAEGGIRPVLVSGWADHVAAIERSGLSVTHQASGEVERVDAVGATPDDLASAGQRYPLAYIAAKCQGTDRYAELLEQILEDDGVVVTVQNGINTEVLADHLGSERVMGGVAVFGAIRTGPGAIRRTGASSWMVIGELGGGRSERAEAVAALTSHGTWQTDVSTNVMGVLWTKVINNGMVNALAVIGGWTVEELMLDPRGRTAAMAMMLEGIDVAGAAGVELEPLPTIDIAALGRLAATDPGAVEDDLRRFGRLFPDTRVSSLQDVDAGRATELPWFTGHIVGEGERLGIPTPVSALALEAATRIEAGEPRTQIIDDVFVAIERSIG